MANRIYLESLNDPKNEDDHVSIGSASNMFPILWATLFEPEDLITEIKSIIPVHYLDGQCDSDAQLRFLRTSTEKALARLSPRITALKNNFPQTCWKYFDHWQKLIESLQQPFIQIRIEEYLWFFSDTEEVIEELNTIAKFDKDSLLKMIKDCSLENNLLSGLVGFIEETFNWDNEDNSYLVLGENGDMFICSKPVISKVDSDDSADKKQQLDNLNNTSSQTTSDFIQQIESTTSQKHSNLAVQLLIDKSNTHEKDFQYLLGMMHLTGCVVPTDIDISLDLLRRAATAGNIDAADKLGQLYYNGIEVSQNFEKSHYWFKIAASANHPNSLHMLSIMYKDGNHVDQSESQYLYYLERSAELGFKKALLDFGYENLIGDLLPKNVPQAMKLLKHAALQKDDAAEYILGVTYLYGNEKLEPNITEGLKWLERSANQNNNFALYQLGIMFLEGELVEIDIKQGMELLKLSAKLGNDEASEKLRDFQTQH